MKYVWTLIILISGTGIAQKPSIDTSVFNKWPSVGNPTISDDGNYVLYTINNQPVGGHTMVIQATKHDWEVEVPGVTHAIFTRDNRRAVYIQPNDSLCICTLGTGVNVYIDHVHSFKLCRQGKSEWLACLLEKPAKELSLRNLLTGNQTSFTDVTDYRFSEDGCVLLLQTKLNKDDDISQNLEWINLPEGNRITIWSTNIKEQSIKSNELVFDASNNQLAFMVEEKINNQIKKSLWYYKAGTTNAILLAQDSSDSIPKDLQLDKISSRGFSKDGTRLFLTLKEKNHPVPKPDAVKVDIWSYTDKKLQSEQLSELNAYPKSYVAVININDHRIIRLQQENERIWFLGGKADDFATISKLNGSIYEGYWNPTSQSAYYIVSIKTGERKMIEVEGKMNIYQPSLSGRFIACIDSCFKNYFSYEISTGVMRNITERLPLPLVDSEYDRPDHSSRGISIAAWMADDTAILFYDKYDIWKVDPMGLQAPVNITNGYGRRHNIVFSLSIKYSDKVLHNNEKLILSAFNRDTKENGFYSKSLDKKGDPDLLTMGPYIYDVHRVSFTSDFAPLKARDADIYLVERMSATESPNYFVTKNFKDFSRLSVISPEKNYNWLTTELITWESLNGYTLQGVLYKPEDFNPQKKYPVIIHYYEKKSDALHAFLKPEAAEGWINIPWFVSKGYVIFTPDIHYTIGEPGQSAYNSVVSAANYLAKLPWIDAAKIGLQGHSFGGYETNYIVTHTNIFAAAISASGIDDMISHYGSVFLGQEGVSLQVLYEAGQNRIGASLWQRPDLYIKNSPIFQADKINTPLLLMNNKEDAIIPFAQGVEFFTALRRLGKKVWMLQYDGEGHSLYNEKNKIDYTLRITEFFDYYLKNAVAPVWMSHGIPAQMKGIENGLELVK
jgi:dienelactone hydrolase